MACVTAWAIAAADQRQEVVELRDFLVKLSGRQMQHQREFTYPPALLAGLWAFLAMFEVINSYSQRD